jgi:hypothetical protein
MPDNQMDAQQLELALGFFDSDYYLTAHPSIDLAGLSPFKHYLQLGWRLGFNPSERFDGNAYLKSHSDVARADMNPLLHYALAGRVENRLFSSVRERADRTTSSQATSAATASVPKSEQGLPGKLVTERKVEREMPQTSSSEFTSAGKPALELELDPAQDSSNAYSDPVLPPRKSLEMVGPLEGDKLAMSLAFFDEGYYLSNDPDIDLGDLSAFEHYVQSGWKEGFNPSEKFDGNAYLKLHVDVAAAGMNPLVHYALAGHGEKRSLTSLTAGSKLSYDYETPRAYFSEDYYVRQLADGELQGMDPYDHYMTVGWKKLYNPQDQFNTREYLSRNPDVEISGVNPLAHYACFGVHEGRSIGSIEELIHSTINFSDPAIFALNEHQILARAQDFLLPMDIADTQKLCVFVLPEHNAMSGGIFSIFSIVNQLRKTRREHGYDVILMTRPNPQGLTYVRNSAFRNSETVYRFEQLRIFRNVRDLQLHIPEYATVDFVRNMSKEMMSYLLRRDTVHINVLNQNIRLMPEEYRFRDLRRIATSIGLSAAHHAYASQEWADTYQLPTLLLPAYTDLTEYPGLPFSRKEKLIITSDDAAPYRARVEEKLKQLKDYEFVSIKNMTFDKYMDLATRCRFSISFGEGFDGYVAQPIYQGGIGFALYTDEFFPNDRFLAYENFFASEKDMIDKIVPTIRRLEADQKRYEALNTSLRAEWDALYSFDDYLARIGKLVRKEYEKFPGPICTTAPILSPAAGKKKDAPGGKKVGTAGTLKSPQEAPMNGARRGS